MKVVYLLTLRAKFNYKGDHNKVLNSYFKNIDWSATQLDGLMVTINVDGYKNGANNEIAYRASATVWPGEASIFSYNVVSNTGLVNLMGLFFQGTKNTVQIRCSSQFCL